VIYGGEEKPISKTRGNEISKKEKRRGRSAARVIEPALLIRGANN
jgi:hypothetical protein